MGKWYDKGFKEAVAGLDPDPPWQALHRDYTAYQEGYADGERQLEAEAERENNPRCEDCGELLDAKERELGIRVCLACSVETVEAIEKGEF